MEAGPEPSLWTAKVRMAMAMPCGPSLTGSLRAGILRIDFLLYFLRAPGILESGRTVRLHGWYAMTHRQAAGRRRGDRSDRWAAFTLIELLVVMGVVALLVSILLPVLGKARDAAKVAGCLGNVQQQLVGTHAYAADRKGFLPTGPRTPSAIDPTKGWDRLFCNWLWVGLDFVPPGGTPHPTGSGVLVVEGYLTDRAAVTCPGADQPEIYEADLENLRGSSLSVFTAYGYRSYDQATGGRLEDLGLNEAGGRATMLFLDINRHGPVGLLPSPATNHRERTATIGYTDGHAAAVDNAGGHFTAREQDYADFPASTLPRFAQMIVNADFAATGDPAGAPALP